MQRTLQEVQKGDQEGERNEESRLGLNRELPTVVITTYNEEKNLQRLVDALLSQSVNCNIVVVDSESKDNTLEILKKCYSSRLIYKVTKCTRGQGRNIGVQMADSNFILFTDGDAIPEKDWVECMVKCLQNSDLVAGETIQEGPMRYASHDRVKLYYHGFEITAPAMNLAVRKNAFLKVKGFDSRFITAEDIDLNLKIMSEGFKGITCEGCRVIHRTRDRFLPFLKQAFWNGYGRGQLRNKNRSIWNEVRKDKIKLNEINFYWLIRNAAAVTGYVYFLIFGKRF